MRDEILVRRVNSLEVMKCEVPSACPGLVTAQVQIAAELGSIGKDSRELGSQIIKRLKKSNNVWEGG